MWVLNFLGLKYTSDPNPRQSSQVSMCEQFKIFFTLFTRVIGGRKSARNSVVCLAVSCQTRGQGARYNWGIQGVTHKQKAKYILYIYPLHNPVNASKHESLPICHPGIIPWVSDTQFLGMEGWKIAKLLSLFCLRSQNVRTRPYSRILFANKIKVTSHMWTSSFQVRSKGSDKLRGVFRVNI